jgi:hypothetical protein
MPSFEENNVRQGFFILKQIFLTILTTLILFLLHAEATGQVGIVGSMLDGKKFQWLIPCFGDIYFEIIYNNPHQHHPTLRVQTAAAKPEVAIFHVSNRWQRDFNQNAQFHGYNTDISPWPPVSCLSQRIRIKIFPVWRPPSLLVQYLSKFC